MDAVSGPITIWINLDYWIAFWLAVSIILLVRWVWREHRSKNKRA